MPGLHWWSPTRSCHLPLTQLCPWELLRGNNLSPVFQPKAWGHLRGNAPSPCTLESLSASLWTLRAWHGRVGSKCSQGWLLTLCCCLQVLELEVWEQVSGGTLLPSMCWTREGDITPSRAALQWAGGPS